MTIRQSSARSAVLVVVALALISCQQARDPISRVQANVVEKATFAGEWYYMQTVIDSPFSAPYITVGEVSYAERIRFEIQEEYLVARRAYAFISGSEPAGTSGAAEQGVPIAMFRIDSHFDIRRDYNPTTGEEINVIVENEEDRPWYEREYMRVDWSENLITDNDALTWARLFNGIEMRPVGSFSQEPGDPFAPKLIADPETGEVTYIDIVNRVYVEPTSYEDPDWGTIPTCWLADQYYLDCAGAEIAIRNSFLRVDPARDYQPWDYSGDRMARFGYFVQERTAYDPSYGVVDPVRARWINRHDIWQRSHRTDEAGELVACTTDEECADGGVGSVCDLDLARAFWRSEGACTIPYRERTVRPIAYHVTQNFPPELFPDVQHLSDDWNGAFVETVASLRENECLADGGDAGTCAAERDREDGQRVFVWCHNPVTEDDHEACGPVGTVAELGDIRYSIIGWISDPHSEAPLGYGPAATDPVTGEIVAGNLFVYGAEVEILASYGRDLVALLLGDLAEEDVAAGLNVRDVAARLPGPDSGARRTGRAADDHVIRLDGDDAARVNQAMDFSWVRAAGNGQRAPSPSRPSSVREGLERMRNARDAVARRGGFGRGPDEGYARLGALRGTSLEAAMTTPEVLLAVGLDPSAALDDDVLDEASPVRGGSLAMRRALRDFRRRLHEPRCWLEADFAEDGLLGLALEIRRAVEEGDGTIDWYGQRYELANADGEIDYELVRAMLRHPIVQATVSHELGHTLGLRHNFAGSYDALNYHPEYWQLRDDGDMHGRAWDPLTEEEIDGRIREYQTSSMMDYGNNYISTDAMGIGYYDIAAIKMGYGDLVEVFTNAEDPHEMAWINLMELYGWSVILREESFEPDGEVSAYEYTELPAALGGIDRLDQRADVPWTSLQPDEALAREEIYELLVDQEGRPAVPYRFCSDEISDLDPTCMLYDAGADAYESLQSINDIYWNYYIFNNFRRERLGFEVDPYLDRILWHYLIKLQWTNQAYALYRTDFEDTFGDYLGDFMERPDGMGDWTLAAAASYQMLTRIITAPEPGGYSLYELEDGSLAYIIDWYYEPEVWIDGLEGRYLDTDWDWDQGFYWFDALERVGFFYDKVLALELLLDPETAFVGVDTASDVRTYALNFYSTFGPSLTSFLGGLLASDWTDVGPRFGDDGNLVYPDPQEIADGDMPGEAIDPNAAFTIQLYAAALSMALLPQSHTQRYVNESRLFVRGGAEEVELDHSLPYVQFTDPQSGLIYVAASYPDELGRERGVAARMLLHAQALADAEAWDALDSYIATLDAVRALTWQFGFGQ